MADASAADDARVLPRNDDGTVTALVCALPDTEPAARLERLLCDAGAVGIVGSYGEEPGLWGWRYRVGAEVVCCGWGYGEFYVTGPPPLVERLLAALREAPDAEPGAVPDPAGV